MATDPISSGAASTREHTGASARRHRESERTRHRFVDWLRTRIVHPDVEILSIAEEQAAEEGDRDAIVVELNVNGDADRAAEIRTAVNRLCREGEQLFGLDPRLATVLVHWRHG